MRAKEQVTEMMEHFGLTGRGLAAALGVNPYKISDINRGKVVKLSADLRKRIREKFPEVSPEWLATGAGSMLSKDRGTGQVQTISNTTAANITQTQTAGTEKAQEVGRLWRLVEDLRKEINTLLGIIERITGKM